MKKQKIETGKIVGTHGIRGALRVQPWCDTAEFLCNFKALFINKGGDFVKLNILSAKPHGNVVLMQIEEIDTIEKAEALRGKVLYLDRKDLKLPKGSYLISDLINCKVFDNNTKAKLGIISDVSKTGANDVWHIKNNDKEYLIPVIDEVVNSVNIDEEEVIITPLKGIFDNEENVYEN